MNDAYPVTKDEIEDREARWAHVADSKGYRCLVCGERPSYDEREVYFETKLCSYHAYTASKDD